jgi:pimeloyl-ACP methyl ester carboxylesterase
MPRLILLPGMDGTGDLFARFVARLPAGIDAQVVRYPETEALGYPELEGIARRASPSQGEFVLLGESFSGPIAISLAAARPPGLVGLVLCNTFARDPRPSFSWLAPFALRFFRSLAAAHWAQDFLLGSGASGELRASFASTLSRVSRGALLARMRAIRRVDVRALVEEIDVPILVLRASRDLMVPRTAAEGLVRAARNARLADLDGPHFLLQAAPVESAEALGRFVRDLVRS